jgi:hypothetical protein
MSIYLDIISIFDSIRLTVGYHAAHPIGRRYPGGHQSDDHAVRPELLSPLSRRGLGDGVGWCATLVGATGLGHGPLRTTETFVGGPDKTDKTSG